MSNSDDALGDLDATALAALVRKREVSALELVDDAIRRCAQVNDTLNAVVTDMFDRARAEARAPLGDGPFAGVPFLMKDFGAEVAGVRFTEGSAFLENYIPDVDAELYKRFRRAGLITIGKTNLPELAIGVTTESKFLGPACNPWDPTRTTGGSSGGAGAAVAARIVPMAHGNDVGGSIRIPASCCGLVGLKPTRGRTTLAPHYGDLLAGYFVEHALTRSVRDSAMLLDATHGPAVGDPYVAPPPARPYAEEVGADPGCLKIGFSTATPLGDALDPECVKAVRETAALCESLGHEVIEARPSFDAMALWTQFTTLLASAVAWAVADWARRIDREPAPEHFDPFVWAFSERGRALSAADYLLAMQDVQVQVRAFCEFFEDFDLFLTTTLGAPPVPLGTLVYDGDPLEFRRRSARFSPFTYITNATGQPAISLPLHWTPEDLPVGLHFVGRYGDEGTLIRLAAQLESAKPWNDRRPQVCAV
ncbi:MAG: amidase [Gammaproteobacteria bacterium]|nr:amidase [Pseudomonadota bacterium]MCZ6887702.1 amidase [Gammaproteobacteria bacterium]